MPASMLLSYVRGRHGAAARYEEDGCVKHILEVMLAKAKADGPAMRTVTTRAGQGGAVINWLAESKMPPELSVRVLQASRWMQTRGHRLRNDAHQGHLEHQVELQEQPTQRRIRQHWLSSVSKLAVISPGWTAALSPCLSGSTRVPFTIPFYGVLYQRSTVKKR